MGGSSSRPKPTTFIVPRFLSHTQPPPPPTPPQINDDQARQREREARRMALTRRGRKWTIKTPLGDSESAHKEGTIKGGGSSQLG